MLNQPIVRYGDLPQEETDDLVTQAKALRDYILWAQKRIQFAEEWAACEPEPEGALIRVIRQGLEGRTLRKIRYCAIDYDEGSGGVFEYVCLWDDEPDIGNWRGPERNPYGEKAIENSPWRTAT